MPPRLVPGCHCLCACTDRHNVAAMLRLLLVLALIGTGLWVLGPHLAYYLTLWLHAGTTGLVTIGVFLLYGFLLVRFAAVRRAVVGLVKLVLVVVTLGALAGDFSHDERTSG